MGTVDGFILLLVAHTVKLEDESCEVIRIISARRADKKERKLYEHGEI